MTDEQGLFWYGLKASLIQFGGILLIILSLFAFTIHYVLVIVLIIIGIAIVLKGKAMRFQYKMRSGSIIHRGDW